jgi:hypothetical protein
LDFERHPLYRSYSITAGVSPRLGGQEGSEPNGCSGHPFRGVGQCIGESQMVYTNSGSKLISRFIGACEIFAGFPPGSFALSVLGTVARNSNDPKLRREAYDAIENLTLERSSVEKLDPYDRSHSATKTTATMARTRR